MAWLVLQALAIATTVAAFALAASWWSLRPTMTAGERARIGMLLAGGTLFVPWALSWSLLP